LRREFLINVIDSYNAAKKIRRLLRARARQHNPATNSIDVIRAIYDDEMQSLVAAQLEFETLEYIAQSNLELFPTTEIARNLSSIEKYLGKLVDEYEKHNRQADTLPLDKLGTLEEFIGEKGKNFDEKFKKPFRNVVAELQRLIVTNVQTGNSTASGRGAAGS
jgi:hypothetical protein